MNTRARIDADADVRAIARGLGIVQGRNLAEEIRAITVGRIESLLEDLRYEPTSLEELREVVHNHAGLRVVRITSDEDLAVAQRDFANELRGLPKQLAFEFANDTEALVLRRDQRDRLSNSRFVALVDARGDRENRAWFGEWHETGHTLIPDPANNLVLRRTRRERPEPVEQVVDLVASAIGFWAPIVKPVLTRNLAGSDVLVAFEKTREELVTRSSREAAFRAFCNMLTTPTVIVWVDYDCRAADKRRGGNPMRSYALRAKTVIRNSAAIELGMNVPENFRIPDHSVIALAANDASASAMRQHDDLGRWRDSSGRALPARPVSVTTWGRWAAIEAA